MLTYMIDDTAATHTCMLLLQQESFLVEAAQLSLPKSGVCTSLAFARRVAAD